MALPWPGFMTACSRQPVPVRHEYTQLHMGVETRLVIWALPDIAEPAAREAFRRIAALDSVLSDYRSDSEVERVNAEAGGAPVPADPALVTVLSHALELARRTNGAFDPTVGPVSRIWRGARRAGAEPDAHAVRAAAALVNWADVRIDQAGRTIQLARPGMRLDLGGIAKGYACDEALAILRGHGVTRALVQMGGEIAVIGVPSGEVGWRIRLAGSADSILLTQGALSTSGPEEQFLEVEGTRYSHVLDPQTGFGLTGGETVIVRAANAMLADALATAAAVLDADGRAALARAFPDVQITIRVGAAAR